MLSYFGWKVTGLSPDATDIGVKPGKIFELSILSAQLENKTIIFFSFLPLKKFEATSVIENSNLCTEKENTN